MSPWWKRITDPTPDPTLDRGDRQRLMVTSAPPVPPAPSPHADLAGWRIRVDQLEKELHAETTAHGETLGELRRESARLAIAREQRDAARAVEAQTAVSWCPHCASDVECLPLGWWCDECTRTDPAGARDYGVRAIHDRIAYLGDDRRPCAKCTDRVHTLSARDWCDWCESCAVQDGDEELVEKARVLGDEIGQRDRTAAVEGAAITLRAHSMEMFASLSVAPMAVCRCGWPGGTGCGDDHAHHVAEQLAAVGALGNSVEGSAPKAGA